jgi:hypothetical protein
MKTLRQGFWSELHDHPIEVLFVSGLYGLLFWDEAIQDYDCHLGDEIRAFRDGGDGEHYEGTVADLWRPLLTEVLCEFINGCKSSNRPIREVFELLSEERYQGAFNWARICRATGTRVHHRIFRPPITGTDALPLIAQMLATYLDRFHEESSLFQPGKWVALPTSLGPKYEFSFEYPRKNEWDRLLERILADYPALRTHSREVLEQVGMAEISWQKAKQLDRFDFGAIIVSYWKCVEVWLESVWPGWETRYRTARQAIHGNPAWWEIARDVDSLSSLRGSGAHASRIAKTKADVERARRLTLQILSTAARFRPGNSAR